MKNLILNEVEIKIVCGFLDEKSKEKFFISDKEVVYCMYGKTIKNIGFMNGMSKALVAKEGENFKGWKKKPYYKYTEAELDLIF